jgi:hypothetical protein
VPGIAVATLRCFVEKRTEQNCINDAESRGASANPEAQSRDCYKGEGRLLSQLAERKLEIVHFVMEEITNSFVRRGRFILFARVLKDRQQKHAKVEWSMRLGREGP